MPRVELKQPQGRRVSEKDEIFKTVVAGMAGLINNDLDSQKRKNLLATIDNVSRTAGLFLRSMSLHLTLFAMSVLSVDNLSFTPTGLKQENLPPTEPLPPLPLPLIVITQELIKWCFSLHNTKALNTSRSDHPAHRQLVDSKPEGSESYDGRHMSHILEAVAKAYSVNVNNYL